jgi:hypothetical protein
MTRLLLFGGEQLQGQQQIPLRGMENEERQEQQQVQRKTQIPCGDDNKKGNNLISAV